MVGSTSGIAWASALLVVQGMVGLALAQGAAPSASGLSVSGELAFSEPIVFDYDRDGHQERVQFWIELEARPAPGEPSPEVESGALRYFVFDLDSEQRIDDWMLGFNMTMGGGFPQAGEPYPLTAVRIAGRTARFDFLGSTWTITDGGDSWAADTIEIRDVTGLKKARFYGGDVRVVADPLAPQPLDIEANRGCNECHAEAATTMAAGGGPHRELACAECHAEHPPDAEGAAIPRCQDCHEGHSEATTAATCVECHAGHDFARVVHTTRMPDSYCGACHGDVSDTLRASRSLHLGVHCALCHQSEHGAPAKECGYCHRGAHPRQETSRPGGCADCHGTAHDLDRGRAG